MHFSLSDLSLALPFGPPAQQMLGDPVNEYHPFHASYNDRLGKAMEEWHVPSLSIAIIDGNSTFAKGFNAPWVASEDRATPSTLYQGASTTKSFTASLAGLIVQNETVYKDITWSTPLHKILGDDFVLRDAYRTEHVNFYDALSHRTGMPRHDFVWLNQELDVQGEVRAFRHLPSTAGFRTKWQYCNMMFTAVSHAIQTLTGKWHGDLLREWIFQPLGMNESYYSLDDAFSCRDVNPRCNVAKGYVWDNDTSTYVEHPASAYHTGNGAGGIISNVLDYSKWLRALIYEAGPLSKDGHKALKSPKSLAAEEAYPYTGPLWYGLGMNCGIYRGVKVCSHNGDIGAYASKFMFIPDLKWGVIAFENAVGYVVDIACWRALDEYLGGSEESFANMNEHFRNLTDYKIKRAREAPRELYPDVPRIPLPPRLSMNDYTGRYRHVAYGELNISLQAPYPVKPVASPFGAQTAGAAGLPLYTKTRHENLLLTFHHVSGEYWLVETRQTVHNSSLPDAVTKAKFEVGENGAVEKVGAIVQEGLLEGDEAWAWFERVTEE